MCYMDLNQITATNRLCLTSSPFLGFNGKLALNVVREKYLPQKINLSNLGKSIHQRGEKYNEIMKGYGISL